MSVGGVVSRVDPPEDGRLWVDTREPVRPFDTPVGVFLEDCKAARDVRVGDSLWWQGRFAYWTPKGPLSEKYQGRSDIPIRRVSCSGLRPS